MHLALTEERSWPCFSPSPAPQDIAENGCSAVPEEPLPRTAPSPLPEKKDPKLREDRRPITVHFGQVGLGVSCSQSCASAGIVQRNVMITNMPNASLSSITELCCFSFISVLSV